MLTKTDYLAYLQCPKALWLGKYHPELATPPDEAAQRRMRIGQDVDVAAHRLHRIISRPFPKPETGRIAVKVINHYGDEVLKVYETT